MPVILFDPVQPVRCVITGDREWRDRSAIRDLVVGLPPGSEVIEGECRGADLLARAACDEIGVTVHPFPYLGHLGRAGGPVRNRQMRDKLLEPVWTGQRRCFAFHADLRNSRGTKDMLRAALAAGVLSYVYEGAAYGWRPVAPAEVMR